MRSKTHSSKCPECGQETQIYHGTYLRKVQDLPILGKTARLHITAHEYVCNNESCSKVTFVEDFDGFLSYYGRMTERCADFICMLAMETSCEGCAHICRAMNLQISGDSVIRLLTKRYRLQPVSECGSILGVDDILMRPIRSDIHFDDMFLRNPSGRFEPELPEDLIRHAFPVPRTKSFV